MKLVSMSRNIVKVMDELSKNQGLARLLVYDVENPFSKDWKDISPKKLLPNKNEKISKIHPYPFDPDAHVEDSSFIRVYYNNGNFSSNEVIAESQIHIDIVVAKSLWLIHDEIRDESLIRPYEIMSRVIETVGNRSHNPLSPRLKFDAWQHLAVNNKFDAIRLYAEYMSVES